MTKLEDIHLGGSLAYYRGRALVGRRLAQRVLALKIIDDRGGEWRRSDGAPWGSDRGAWTRASEVRCWVEERHGPELERNRAALKVRNLSLHLDDEMCRVRRWVESADSTTESIRRLESVATALTTALGMVEETLPEGRDGR